MKNFLFLLALLAGGLALPAPSQAQGPTDKQFQAIEKLMAPQRKKVTDILEADKTGQYQTYKADAERLVKEKDPARQQELAEKLERDHLAFIRKAYAGAKINNAELRQEVARILGPIQFSFGEFADIQIDFIPPGLALPTRFDVTLNCPFNAQDENDNSAIASQCDAEAFDCSIAVESLAEVAGGCKSKADVGGEFVLPEGTFTNITVVAKSDIFFDGWVGGVGYGQINAKFGIRFRAPGLDKVVMAKEVIALAPIIWLTHLRGDINDFSAQASFTGNFSGGTTIKAQVHTEVFAISALLNLAMMDGNTSEIHSIGITGSD